MQHQEVTGAHRWHNKRMAHDTKVAGHPLGDQVSLATDQTQHPHCTKFNALSKIKRLI